MTRWQSEGVSMTGGAIALHEIEAGGSQTLD
jgi:hypothetical protein